MKPSRVRAFTLIELLVVISIIGVLSSVVLMSLTNARKKGNEAAIIQSLMQFRNLYELAYSDKGNYSDLQPVSVPTPSGSCIYYSGSSGFKCSANTLLKCQNIFGDTGDITNPNAVSLCKQIVAMTGNFTIGLANTSSNQYSFWAWLPSQNKFMCYGSSKNQSTTASSPDFSPGNLLPGCPANP